MATPTSSIPDPAADNAPPAACASGGLLESAARNDVLNRLRRAEGQLRGIQRMVERARIARRSRSSSRRCAGRWTAPTCA